MKTKNIIFSFDNKKLFVRVISLLDRFNVLNEQEKFLDIIIQDLKTLKEKGHIAGFLNEKKLREQLKINIFDKKMINGERIFNKLKFDDIISLIKETIHKIKDIAGERKISIYIFPTNSNFIINKMGGVFGLVAWKNIIHIYLFPTKSWRINFKSTLLHEIAHCIQPYYSYDMNLFDHLIAEGLAEHFQEYYTKKRNSWTRAITRKKAVKIFRKIKEDLYKTIKNDSLIHSKLFFGSRNYPHWAGYTIGYYLILDYLKQNKNISWKKLLKQEPNSFKEKLKNWFY